LNQGLIEILVLAFIGGFVLFRLYSVTTRARHAEAAIRRKVDDLVQALRAKDIDRLIAHYAHHNVTFDVQPPLKVVGTDAYRKNFEHWFATIEGAIGYEVADLQIAASDDVGFCHSLCKVTSTRKSGEKVDYWVRVTSGLLKIKDQWKIVHEHVSLPINMQTMTSPPGLEP
jgi:ketosteroid isomerase-like protein